MTRSCTVAGCPKPYRRNGMCQMHALRLERHGSTDPRPGWHGTPTERFAAYVVRADTGCWTWTGPVSTSGYPRAGKAYAHRLSYEIHRGQIASGMSVLHRCDNPLCTNPEHLFLGTHEDNMADAARKGRLNGRPNRPRGEVVKTSKLTVEQVLELRQLADAGWQTKDLANRYGVSADTVRLVKARKRWAHV